MSFRWDNDGAFLSIAYERIFRLLIINFEDEMGF